MTSSLFSSPTEKKGDLLKMSHSIASNHLNTDSDTDSEFDTKSLDLNLNNNTTSSKSNKKSKPGPKPKNKTLLTPKPIDKTTPVTIDPTLINKPTSKPTSKAKTEKAQQPATTALESLETVRSKLNEYQKKMPFLMDEEDQQKWNFGRNNCSDSYARELLQKIRIQLRCMRKEMMVNTMFDSFCDLTEEGMVNLLQDRDMEGFSHFMKDNKATVQLELDELAIEMSDDYIPGAKIRLLMAMGTMIKQYKKINSEKKQQQQQQ